MISNSKLLTGVTVEFVRKFKRAGFSAQRAAQLLGITPATASFYASGHRGEGIELSPATIRAIRYAVRHNDIPRAELFRCCIIEILESGIVIKSKLPKGDGSDREEDYPYDPDRGEGLRGK